MEKSVQLLAGVCLLVISVSHVARPREWARFFVAVREQGEATAGFVNGFIHLPLGLIIVSFHNVWTWPEVLLTIAGWGLVLKAFLSFVRPRHAAQVMGRVSPERAWEFAVAGGFGILFAAFCLYLALRRG